MQYEYMCNTSDKTQSNDYESINDLLQDLKAALQNPSVSISYKTCLAKLLEHKFAVHIKCL